MAKTVRRPKKIVNRKLPKKKVTRRLPKKTVTRRKQKKRRTKRKKQIKHTHNKLHLSKIQSDYPPRTHKLYSASTQNELHTINKKQNTNIVSKMHYANLYKNMKNQEKQCKVMNPDQEVVDLPSQYPGDDWVHANLMYNRDKPVEAFDSDVLKEQFHKYRKMC